MQHHHKRLFCLLTLLLLRWVAPSFAAQTWTTVWTPGSASTKTISKSNNDHESKTNCYPCKEWDDYANEWTDYPEGTEPVICAGDSNDYTCKECDGGGGLQDVADGTDCDAGNGKPGKCCDGICYEDPMDPCDWAAANQDQFSQQVQNNVWGDPDCFGYVVCINGEATDCVIYEHVEAQHSDWTPEMIACICEHELDHINSGANCPDCGYGVATFPDEETQRQGECSAYKTQWECLNDIEPETDVIRRAKAAYWDYMFTELQCPIMPDPFI